MQSWRGQAPLLHMLECAAQNYMSWVVSVKNFVCISDLQITYKRMPFMASALRDFLPA